MIYLSGVDCEGSRALARSYPVGLIVQPGSYGPRPLDHYPYYALDNGCFTSTWEPKAWLRWLDRLPRDRALFAVAPDVVCDWQATRRRWDTYAPVIVELGFRPCYVLQNGQPTGDVPASVPVFIGGDTAWKLGHEAAVLTMEANHRGQHVHMGRANSMKRLKRAQEMHCNSVDGTFLKYAPNINTERLRAFLHNLPRDYQLAMA